MNTDIGIQQGLLLTKSVEPSISIIVPTRNEAENVEPLLSRIEQATRGITVEVIFVDDSTDETPRVIQEIQNRFSIKIVLIARPPDQRGNGLGGAVIEGFRKARAPFACVMDGDLQHPPELIPQLLKQSEETGADVVVGSRLAPGADASSLGTRRSLVSHSFAMLAHAAFPLRLGKVSDPLSGLFLIRLAAIDPDCLRPDGFKILLEILARFPNLSVSEIPFQFGHRNAGQSKASVGEVLRFIRLLLRLRLAGSQHFIEFVSVGASGILVNSLVLAVVTERLHIYYLLSLALATIGSTLWNFALTEFWVYRDRQEARGRLGRFGMFFLMNNAALLLRGPIVYVLTSLLGIYYLISNLVSLAALTVLRYAFADKLIWEKRSSSMNNSRGSFNYDIHGIVTVVSDAILPELEPFRSQVQFERPAIRVHLGKSPRAESTAASSNSKSRRIHYDEGLGIFGFSADIEIGDFVEVWASPFLKWSPHVLYTNLVEPILRWSFVEKGYALVHGACLDFGGKAYLVTARTDTGKTTSILKILSRQRRATDRGAFISDDLTLVSPTGKVLTYPKPLTISHHTVKAINSQYLSWYQRLALLIQSRVHSRGGRVAAHVLGRTKLPMATMNALVQFLVPPPKYYVQQLVPGAKLSREADLAGMFVIERSLTNEEARLKHEEALEILFSNCEDAYGFPPYDAIKQFLYMSNGRDLRNVEHEIIAQALSGRPDTLIRRNQMDWWRKIPVLMDENLAVDFQAPAHTPSNSNLRTLPRLRMLSFNTKEKNIKSSLPKRRFSDLSQNMSAPATQIQAGD